MSAAAGRCKYVQEALRSVAREVRLAVTAFALVFLFSVLGLLVLSWLESEAEALALQEEAEVHATVVAELSATTSAKLLELGWLRPQAPDAQHWDLSTGRSRARGLFYSFGVLSSIGYGPYTLRTEGGRAFVAFFALLSIPIFVLANAYLSGRLLAAVRGLAAAADAETARAFGRFAEEGAGAMKLRELKPAVRDQVARDITDYEVMRLLQELDVDGSKDSISYVEYCKALQLLRPLAAQKQDGRRRLAALLLATALWLVLGSAVLCAAEGWDFTISLWFCWVTVTTLGFGDFMPATPEGEIFVIFWATVGLGVCGMVLTEVGNAYAATPFLTRLTKEIRSMPPHLRAQWRLSDEDALPAAAAAAAAVEPLPREVEI